MRVNIDARWPVGGGIRRMVDLYRAEAPATMELHDLDIPVAIGSPRSPFAVTKALRAVRTGARAEVFWNPGFIPPLPNVMKSVVTVHDLTHLHHYTRAHRFYYNAVFRPLYRRCDLIVCISEYTRNEFLSWSGVSEDRVIVVPNAIDPGFSSLSPPLETDRPFLFYAGNRRSFKNVPLIVRAFVESALARDGFQLVLTGAPDAALRDIAQAGGVPDALRFTGFLDDAGIVAHYKAATAVVFLSKYEGFGLPILEAFQCGTPLLLARATSFPEVAGDAAVFVAPDDLAQTAQSMRLLATDAALRRDLVAKGRARLALFDASRSSALLWRAIGEVGAA